MENASYSESDMLQDLERSLAVAETSFGADSEEVARILRMIVFINKQAGDLKRGIGYALRLRKHYEGASAVNSADYHKLLLRIARFYSVQGHWELAAKHYQDIIALKVKSGDYAGEFQAMLLLAHCYIQTKNFQEAAELLEDYVRRDGPLLVQAYTFLAQALSHLDKSRADRALIRQQEVIEDRGPDPSEIFDGVPEQVLLVGLFESALVVHA